jgi:hypothetical protein
MRKRLLLRKGADLEELIGGNYGTEVAYEGWTSKSFDVETMRRNIQVLRMRDDYIDFENHFSMFNAISLLPDFTKSKAILDEVDAALTDYILTCRKDSKKADPNLMLCDLIVAHWPIDRALKLSRLILEDCRYVFRIDALLGELSWHNVRYRPKYRAGIEALCCEYSKSRNARKRRLAALITRIFQSEGWLYIRDADLRGITRA